MSKICINFNICSHIDIDICQQYLSRLLLWCKPTSRILIFVHILILIFVNNICEGGCSGINRAYGGIKRGSVNQLLPNFRCGLEGKGPKKQLKVVKTNTKKSKSFFSGPISCIKNQSLSHPLKLQSCPQSLSQTSWIVQKLPHCLFVCL